MHAPQNARPGKVSMTQSPNVVMILRLIMHNRGAPHCLQANRSFQEKSRFDTSRKLEHSTCLGVEEVALKVDPTFAAVFRIVVNCSGESVRSASTCFDADKARNRVLRSSCFKENSR